MGIAVTTTIPVSADQIIGGVGGGSGATGQGDYLSKGGTDGATSGGPAYVIPTPKREAGAASSFEKYGYNGVNGTDGQSGQTGLDGGTGQYDVVSFSFNGQCLWAGGAGGTGGRGGSGGIIHLISARQTLGTNVTFDVHGGNGAGGAAFGIVSQSGQQDTPATYLYDKAVGSTNPVRSNAVAVVNRFDSRVLATGGYAR